MVNNQFLWNKYLLNIYLLQKCLDLFGFVFRNLLAGSILLLMGHFNGSVLANELTESAPVLNILLSKTSGVAPLTIQANALMDASNGEVVKFIWDFGDGTFAHKKELEHTFFVPGSYTVSVRAKFKNGLTAITSKEVLVDDPSDENDGSSEDKLSTAVFFDRGSALLNTEAKDSIKAVADKLREHPDIEVNLAGYTDASGAISYNQRLSSMRAQSVADFFIMNGISSDRLVVKGFGEYEPVADNSTIDGRARDRRVVIDPSFPKVRESMRLVPNSEYSTASGLPLYRVWYGTNRKPSDDGEGFSSNRDSKLHFGRVYVEVPKSHSFGSVGSSWVVRLVNWSDDRLKVVRIEDLDENTFINFARNKLRNRDEGKRTIFVYIHGFKTSFNESAIRAAQIGFDLKVEGLTALFSWPSEGELLKYNADEATIQASEPYLKEYLLKLVNETGAERVDVLAHSMGNRAFLRVIADLENSNESIKFGQIILAAPDVDADTFMQIAAVYPSMSDRTTLYSSSKDAALFASTIIHDHNRAGFYPPVTLVKGIDTIKVSKIDLTILGHSYFGDTKAVLYDMHNLIRNNLKPNERIRLRPEPSPPANPSHWEIIE